MDVISNVAAILSCRERERRREEIATAEGRGERKEKKKKSKKKAPLVWVLAASLCAHKEEPKWRARSGAARAPWAPGAPTSPDPRGGVAKLQFAVA